MKKLLLALTLLTSSYIFNMHRSNTWPSIYTEDGITIKPDGSKAVFSSVIPNGDWSKHMGDVISHNTHLDNLVDIAMTAAAMKTSHTLSKSYQHHLDNSRDKGQSGLLFIAPALIGTVNGFQQDNLPLMLTGMLCYQMSMHGIIHFLKNNRT